MSFPPCIPLCWNILTAATSPTLVECASHIAQVLLAEAVFFGKRASRKVVAAIVVVCLGVGLSTVTDTQVCFPASQETPGLVQAGFQKKGLCHLAVS